jgi:hypothetical protein
MASGIKIEKWTGSWAPPAATSASYYVKVLDAAAKTFQFSTTAPANGESGGSDMIMTADLTHYSKVGLLFRGIVLTMPR